MSSLLKRKRVLAASKGAGSSTLINGLTSYWKLDEASGNRADSHGTNHLTPTNAPVGAAGKIGNGCDFESSSAQVLSCPDNQTINLSNTDFTFTGWLKPESLPSYAVIFSKDPASSFEYRGEGSSLVLLMNGSITVTITGLAVGSWAFFVCGLDTVADVLFVQLNNGAPVSVSTAATAALVSVALNVGARSDGSIGFDGLIDEVGLWRRVLTAQERTDLYNGGVGKTYPFTPSVAPFGGLVSAANLVSYWKLNETSGNRLDSHGTNHLTPTNNPVGAGGKIGNGCDFEASSSQYLSIPSNASLQPDADISFTAWVKFEGVPPEQWMILSKDSDSGRQFTLEHNGAAFAFGCGHFAVQVVLPLVPVIGTWYFVVAWIDATTGTWNIQVNDGIAQSVSMGFPPVFNTEFRLGARQYPGFPGYFDGIIDEVGLWRRVLTPAERTALYNSGNGLAY